MSLEFVEIRQACKEMLRLISFLSFCVLLISGQQCENEKAKTLDEMKEAELEGDILVGGFIPSCDENGDYELIQCHGSMYALFLCNYLDTFLIEDATNE